MLQGLTKIKLSGTSLKKSIGFFTGTLSVPFPDGGVKVVYLFLHIFEAI